MGFIGDKKLIWTKNKFEQFLNTALRDELVKNNVPDILINNIGEENFGSKLRRKNKDEFSRYYLMWLNTK